VTVVGMIFVNACRSVLRHDLPEKNH